MGPIAGYLAPLVRTVAGVLLGALVFLALFGLDARVKAGEAWAQTPLVLINQARLWEPLVRTKSTTEAEDLALARALEAHNVRTAPEDVSRLVAFVSAHPQSGWTAAVQTNLGFSHLYYGYFSRALEAWRAAWTDGKDAQDVEARALVDRSASELARLYASLGHFDDLTALLQEIADRPISGSATEGIQVANETVHLANTEPDHLLICGPLALQTLLRTAGIDTTGVASLSWHNAGVDGTTFAELAALAEHNGLPTRVIHRSLAQDVPVPSVVHWKVGHFAAIIEEAEGKFRLQDPVFPNSERWVSRAALDAEASGYFLVPAAGYHDDGWLLVNC